MTRYFLKTLFRDTTRQTDWSLEIFLILNIRYKHLYSYSLFLCGTFAEALQQKKYYICFFSSNLKIYIFSTQTLPALRIVDWSIQTKRKQTTEHKTFSSFWKTNLFFVDKLSKLILPIVFSYLVLLHELPVYRLYQSKWTFRLILKLSSD